MAMQQRFRRGFTAAERTELWDRWQRGGLVWGDRASVWEAVIVDLFPSSPAFVAQGPKTAETPANTRHVGVAWIPL